jgi:hypothetical protein
MSELRSGAVRLTIAPPARRTPSRLTEARKLVSGVLFTVATVVAGTALLTALLVVGLVTSPIIAAVVAYLVVRHRRLARARTWAAVRTA